MPAGHSPPDSPLRVAPRRRLSIPLPTDRQETFLFRSSRRARARPRLFCAASAHLAGGSARRAALASAPSESARRTAVYAVSSQRARIITLRSVRTKTRAFADTRSSLIQDSRAPFPSISEHLPAILGVLALKMTTTINNSYSEEKKNFLPRNGRCVSSEMSFPDIFDTSFDLG